MALELDLFVEDPNRIEANLPFVIDLWKLQTADVMARWGREMIGIARSLSPSDKLRGIDARRRPESQSFKHQWEWQVVQTGDGPMLEVGNTDERMPLIVGPTSAQDDVVATSGEFLFFYWDKIGQWVKAWSINKPSTPGQPVHEWTLEAFDIDSSLPELGDRLIRRIL